MKQRGNEVGNSKRWHVGAWIGYTTVLKDSRRFTFSIRGRTLELKQGADDLASLNASGELDQLLRFVPDCAFDMAQIERDREPVQK